MRTYSRTKELIFMTIQAMPRPASTKEVANLFGKHARCALMDLRADGLLKSDKGFEFWSDNKEAFGD